MSAAHSCRDDLSQHLPLILLSCWGFFLVVSRSVLSVALLRLLYPNHPENWGAFISWDLNLGCDFLNLAKLPSRLSVRSVDNFISCCNLSLFLLLWLGDFRLKQLWGIYWCTSVGDTLASVTFAPNRRTIVVLGPFPLSCIKQVWILPVLRIYRGLRHI